MLCGAMMGSNQGVFVINFVLVINAHLCFFCSGKKVTVSMAITESMRKHKQSMTNIKYKYLQISSGLKS